MKPDARRNDPWWADYSGKRLVGLLMLLAVVLAIPFGLLRGYLVVRLGWPDAVVGGVTWAISMALPLIIVLRMRKTGRDRWLLRRALRDAGPRENI
jgi:MFS-type transporter involved in bile tolerance (Atg22 family)